MKRNGFGSIDLNDVLTDIVVPDLEVGSVACNKERTSQKDIFAEHKQKAWDKTTEARCDFSYKLRLTRRSNVNFISIWQKTLYGRTLTDIKGDDSMVQFFADAIVPVIRDTLGTFLDKGDWCVVTTPKRRHKVKNFATMIAEEIGKQLGLPFYEDCATAPNKHRMGAVFSLNLLPKENNIIVFDDFVTTGQTLRSMKNLLEQQGKNTIFFAGINNKL